MAMFTPVRMVDVDKPKRPMRNIGRFQRGIATINLFSSHRKKVNAPDFLFDRTNILKLQTAPQLSDSELQLLTFGLAELVTPLKS